MNSQDVLHRRAFLSHTSRTLLGGAALCTAPQAGWGQNSSQHRRPNVILIMTDDQGYGDIGCHGNNVIQTPNLDRLASESVEFTQFCVSPVCAPTRASLMTGRYNYRTGVVDTYLGRAMMHPDETTIAEMLGGAGYRTGIFGKWHLGDNYPLRAMDQGFQEAFVHQGGGVGQPSDPPGNTYFDPIVQHNGRPEKTKGYCTDVFTSAAIDFIKENRDRPFFAYLSTNAPHTPLQIDDEYVKPYRDKGVDETTAKIYGMVANIDENIGRLLQTLEELQLQEDTIVIFLTDNGPQQNRYTAGLRGRKGTVYEGGIRVPFFIRWPGRLQAGQKVDRLAAHIDVTPTLLRICGVSAPENVRFDGASLLPLLNHDARDWQDRTLFFQWHRGDVPEPFRKSAVRSQRYKLVDGKELYDLQDDPGEKNDVATQHPDLVEQFRKAYEAWYADVSGTRGYDPPRIQIGTPHEPRTILTRQDWRGPKASWSKDGLGYWEVDVKSAGSYRVTVRFREAESPGTVDLRLGSLSEKQNISAKQTDCTFEGVKLTGGPGRLETWIQSGGKRIGAAYIEVERL